MGLQWSTAHSIRRFKCSLTTVLASGIAILILVRFLTLLESQERHSRIRQARLASYDFTDSIGVINNIVPCETEEEIAFDRVRHLDPLDPEVLHYLRCFRLHPPSSEPYDLQNPSGDPAHYRQHLKRLFRNKPPGFFIECGANDGEFLSNTIGLERDYGWTGLLIEAHPKYANEIQNKHRKAWYSDVCLSPNRTVQEMEFLETLDMNDGFKQGIGKLDMPDDLDTVFQMNTHRYNFKSYGMVRCFPLVSLLAALEVTHVDFFSLDVQGIEYKILKTLPFDESLEIEVLQLEHNLAPEGKSAIENVMSQAGYDIFVQSNDDFIFKLRH